MAVDELIHAFSAPVTAKEDGTSLWLSLRKFCGEMGTSA